MDKNETKNLFIEIVKVYPRFEANIDNWTDRLKDLPLNKALKILEKHIDGDKGDYAPTLAYFIRQSKTTSTDTFLDMTPRKFHVGKSGELLDEEGREYGGTYSDGSPYRYYTNKLGYICRKDEFGNEVRIA